MVLWQMDYFELKVIEKQQMRKSSKYWGKVFCLQRKCPFVSISCTRKRKTPNNSISGEGKILKQHNKNFEKKKPIYHSLPGSLSKTSLLPSEAPNPFFFVSLNWSINPCSTIPLDCSLMGVSMCTEAMHKLLNFCLFFSC